MRKQEHANWHMEATLSKYLEDIAPFRKDHREAEFHKLFTPYEVIHQKGNCLLETGIDEMWDLITGEVSGADHIYSEDYALIGVGDDDTAADPSDTDLKGAANAGSHKQYNAMEAGYPISADQAVTFKSSFASGEANFAWNEWVVKQTTSTICLNRKVESLGTKTTGTWTLEVSITLS
jgi:hypothetical protein